MLKTLLEIKLTEKERKISHLEIEKCLFDMTYEIEKK